MFKDLTEKQVRRNNIIKTISTRLAEQSGVPIHIGAEDGKTETLIMQSGEILWRSKTPPLLSRLTRAPGLGTLLPESFNIVPAAI